MHPFLCLEGVLQTRQALGRMDKIMLTFGFIQRKNKLRQLLIELFSRGSRGDAGKE